MTTGGRRPAREQIEREWLLVLGGIPSVMFAVRSSANPGVEALPVLWLIRRYASAFGVLLCRLGFERAATRRARLVAWAGRARAQPFSSFDDDYRETEAISMAKDSDSTAAAAKDRWAVGFGGTIVSDARAGRARGSAASARR